MENVSDYWMHQTWMHLKDKQGWLRTQENKKQRSLQKMKTMIIRQHTDSRCRVFGKEGKFWAMIHESTDGIYYVD